MNKVQRTVLAIALPVFVLIATYGITNQALKDDFWCDYRGFTAEPKGGECRNFEEKVYPSAFDFKRTWLVWLVAIGCITAIELKLFKEENKTK